MTDKELMRELKKIPGGYEYWGACSQQICFPLKKGGELRFSIMDEDVDDEPKGIVKIDLYGGELPPCITGPSFLTGDKK